MKRRSFLQAVALGIAYATVPIKLANEIVRNSIIKNDWLVDFDSRTIKYVGLDDKIFSLSKVNKIFWEVFGSPIGITEPCPMARVTDTIFHMENDWSFTEDSIAHLNGGSLLTCEGTVYASFICCSSTPQKPHILMRNDKPQTETVVSNHIVKITPDIKELTWIVNDLQYVPQRISTKQLGFPNLYEAAKGGTAGMIHYPLFWYADVNY